MRLALVCHYLPPHEGGIERVVRRLADGYSDAGHEVVMIGWGQAEEARRLVQHQVRALRGHNPLERFGVPVPLIEPVSAWRRLHSELERVDAVHVHGLPYLGSMLALAAAGATGTRAVLTEHVGRVPDDRRLYRLLQEGALGAGCAAARKAAHVVTVLNDRVGELLRPRVAPVPVLKVANGVDLDKFRPADPSERARLRSRFGMRRFTVVAVGRNVPKKGLSTVAASAGPAYDVILVGTGVSRLAAPPECRTFERLDQDDLADLYRAADAMALPSTGEGLPMVVQEALASGLPVVMGDDPAVRAELPAGPIRFIPVGNVVDLRSALVEMCHRGSDMREEARRCAQRWEWARSVERYLELLGASL